MTGFTEVWISNFCQFDDHKLLVTRTCNFCCSSGVTRSQNKLRIPTGTCRQITQVHSVYVYIQASTIAFNLVSRPHHFQLHKERGRLGIFSHVHHRAGTIYQYIDISQY